MQELCQNISSRVSISSVRPFQIISKFYSSQGINPKNPLIDNSILNIQNLSYSKENDEEDEDDKDNENKICNECKKCQKELMESESRCIALSMKNKNLQNQIKQLRQLIGHQNILSHNQHETIANIQNLESVSLTNQQNTINITKFVGGTGEDSSELVKPRIDDIVSEVNKLMDFSEGGHSEIVNPHGIIQNANVFGSYQ